MNLSNIFPVHLTESCKYFFIRVITYAALMAITLFMKEQAVSPMKTGVA